MSADISTPIFDEKTFPFSNLDNLFKKISTEIADGYVTVSDSKSLMHLFIINKKFYSAAYTEDDSSTITSVEEFFKYCKDKASFKLQVYRSDKKVLLCMLVMLTHKPEQSFTTDVVNLEDVIKKILKQKKDVVMTVFDGQEYSFGIFIKGRASYVFIPHQPLLDSTGEPPLDKLLLYCYDKGQGAGLTIEIFGDTKVVPTADSGPFPPEGAVAHYLKGAARVSAVAKLPPPGDDPYVEVLDEAGTIVGRHPITGDLTIGRDSDNIICLDEAGVSRAHAVIKEAGGKYVVEDLKSTNGTLFKGIRVETKELSNGDEINIRKFAIRFFDPSVAAEETMPPPAEHKEEAPDLASQTIYADLPAEDPAEAKKSAVGIVATLILADDSKVPLGSITTIGKDDEADIKVEGMLVSKRHAVIIRGKDIFKIIRKGSFGSIKVNGEKVDEHVLKDGDMVEVGNVTIMFKAGLV